MSGFMQPQVVRGDWWRVEANGTWFVPADVVLTMPPDVEELDWHNWQDRGNLQRLAPYVDGDPVEAELLRGAWGARMSAPGYMDCTEWAVFPTRKEAVRYLQETYCECGPVAGEGSIEETCPVHQLGDGEEG